MKRIIIITGASSGMGKEFAKQLTKTRNVEEIWLIARRIEKLQELEIELKKDNPFNINFKIISQDISGKQGYDFFSKYFRK